MNKTVTINISGIVFHIEEDAYDKLNNYLRTISGHFTDADGRVEIMADIQARIAEMFQERTSAVKQAVVMADVEHVITVMGKPEEFASDNDTSQTGERQNENSYAGSNYTANKHRRLFRDPDDKWVGGVCSGIANYFDCDPLWIRLAWILAALVAGTGVILYILLMIIIPKATTTAEKLEMRGEKVDINNIKRSIQEEMTEIKKKAKSWSNDIKEMGASASNRSRNGIGRFFEFLADIFGNIFRILGKIFTLLFVIAVAILLCVFIAILFSYKGSNAITLNEFDQLLFSQSHLSFLTIFGLILAVAIPLLTIIYKGTTYLIGIRKKNKLLTRIAGGLWILGIILLIYTGVSLASEFSAKARSKTAVTIVPAKNNVLYLNTLQNSTIDEDDEDEDNFSWTSDNNRGNINLHKWGHIDDEKGKIFLRYPVVDIQPAKNDSAQITVIRIAHGKNKKEAFNRTKNITYNLVQHDSLIEFSRYFEINKSDKFRAQQVKVILYIPKGNIIHLGEGMRKIIYDIDNVSDMYDGDMVNHNWKMTEDGLKCLDCKHNSIDDDEVNSADEPSLSPDSKRSTINTIKINAGDKQITIEHNK